MTLSESWTRNGRVRPQNGYVNDRSLAETDRIVSAVNRGDQRAILEVREHLGFAETVTTGDSFIFNLAQYVGLAVDEELENTVEADALAIAPTETRPDFDNIKEVTLTPIEVSGLDRQDQQNPGYELPERAEGAPFAEFQLSASEIAGGESLGIYGARFNITLEAIARDAGVIVPKIPSLALQAATDTIQGNTWRKIVAPLTDTNYQLKAGTNIDDSTVVANAKLSLAAVNQAIYQVRNRVDPATSGRYERKVTVSSFVLLVPKGSKDVAEFLVRGQRFVDRQITNGSVTDRYERTPIGTGLLDLSNSISDIVETDFLTGSQWGLVPAKGATAKNYVSWNVLAAAPAPEVRVQGAAFAGERISGTSLDAGVFGGASFDTDTASLRVKQYGRAILEHPEYAIFSLGTGV
jgi:hypothetical protein